MAWIRTPIVVPLVEEMPLVGCESMEPSVDPADRRDGDRTARQRNHLTGHRSGGIASFPDVATDFQSVRAKLHLRQRPAGQASPWPQAALLCEHLPGQPQHIVDPRASSVCPGTSSLAGSRHPASSNPSSLPSASPRSEPSTAARANARGLPGGPRAPTSESPRGVSADTWRCGVWSWHT